MNTEKIIYPSQTYHAIKAFIFILPPFFAFVSLIIFIARHLHSEGFVVFGWIFVCSVPFLFQKRYKRLFTKRIELELDNDYFVVREYATETDMLTNELILLWSEIQAYKCSFSSSNTFYLSLDLWDGSTKSFSFEDKNNQSQSTNDESIFRAFYHYIAQYNSDKNSENVITLNPGFLTTKSGALILYGLSVLAIITIIIHFVLAPKSFMLSFMSFFIIIGLLAKRKKDTALYSYILNLKSKEPIE